MKVNGLHCDVRVKGVLVEHDGATSEVSNVKVVREALVQKVLNHFSNSIHVPCSPQCVLQWHLLCLVEVQDSKLKMPRGVSSSKRLGALLSKRCSGLGEKCLQSWASRKTGLALLEVPKHKMSKFVWIQQNHEKTGAFHYGHLPENPVPPFFSQAPLKPHHFATDFLMKSAVLSKYMTMRRGAEGHTSPRQQKWNPLSVSTCFFINSDQ